jgi:hypothetical protein
MDFYPLNLVLAVAVASATIFLGFLPARNIRSAFFAAEVQKAAVAWVFIGMASAPAIFHYHIIIAIVCFGAWWQLRRDKALNGKMWLSIASGLGISIGVMLILTTTPRAYPDGLSEYDRRFLLASIYLGGAVVGLAYVCYMLTRGLTTNSGITRAMVQRYTGLLSGMIFARGAVLFISFIQRHPINTIVVSNDFHGAVYMRLPSHAHLQGMMLYGLVLVVLPVLGFLAHRATRLAYTVQASTSLVGICLVGFLAEVLARLLIL